MNPIRTHSAAAVLAMALTCATASVAGAQPAKTGANPQATVDAPSAADKAAGVSNTIEATRSVRVSWDYNSPPPDLTAVAARLVSPAVAGAIGKEVLGLSPEQALAVLGRHETVVRGNEGVIEFGIGLEPDKRPGVRPAAKEFADKLVERVQGLLAEEREERMLPRLASARQQADRAAREYEEVAKRYRQAQAEMTAHAGRADSSPDNTRAALTKLEDEKQRLELELAGLEARQRAVERWIAQTTEQLQARAKDDPVVEELKKALRAQERLVELARKRFEAGHSTEAAVAEAETKLADVRITLLDRQRNGGAAAGGEAAGPLPALNRELQNLSIDMVDRKARLEYVLKRLGPLQQAAQLIPDVEAAAADLPRARRDLEQARERLREVERLLEEAPRDRVIVLEAKDTPAGAKQ